VEAIVGAVGVPVQTGGGQRDDSMLTIGVARIVLGSIATKDPDLVARLAAQYPGRVAVGLHHRHGAVAVRGWTESSGQRVEELIAKFTEVGVAAFVIPDIGRDGLLVGPDTSGLAAAVQATNVPVIASGGVSSLEDLKAVAAVGVAGAI